MKTGIAVFAYCRDAHLTQVLDGLKRNRGVNDLYIFQDGLKCEADRPGWIRTREVIENINWCHTHVYYSEVNKGLADSIVSGVHAVLRENDAIIVLEDDCVPQPSFVTFMNQCLEKYALKKEVHSVSGYSWPIDLKEDGYDAYFCGRISSWGWGTWKDRWASYAEDYTILRGMKNDAAMSGELATWGCDLEQMLIGNVTGKNNSWAVFWALNAIACGGLCLNPYHSLIQNIGLDGTGVHCKKTDRFRVKSAEQNPESFRLPERTGIRSATRDAFAGFYGSYTAVNSMAGVKKRVLIYGLGNFYFQNEKDLNSKYDIAAFVDVNRKGFYAGREIIKPAQIPGYTFDKIIVMVQDIQECINIGKVLMEKFHTGYDNIILGHMLYGRFSKELDFLKVLPDGRLKMGINGTEAAVGSLDEFYNVYEVLVQQNYNYFLNNQRKDVILDVGMNVGDAVLYFLNNPRTEKVYAFEPFRKTFESARGNLAGYLEDKERLEVFQFGISDRNEWRIVGFNEDMTCGQSTLGSVREEVYRTYLDRHLVKEENERTERIEVRRASEVFAPVLDRYSQHNIVLKLDCEGEEYGILKDLSETGLLGRFAFLMIEWHYRGRETVSEYLGRAGFSYWCNDKSEDMGLIYAFRAGD